MTALESHLLDSEVSTDGDHIISPEAFSHVGPTETGLADASISHQYNLEQCSDHSLSPIWWSVLWTLARYLIFPLFESMPIE